MLDVHVAGRVRAASLRNESEGKEYEKSTATGPRILLDVPHTWPDVRPSNENGGEQRKEGEKRKGGDDEERVEERARARKSLYVSDLMVVAIKHVAVRVLDLRRVVVFAQHHGDVKLPAPVAATAAVAGRRGAVGEEPPFVEGTSEGLLLRCN